MARKPMVTRTIETTKVNVLCMELQTAEPFNKDVVLPRTYKDAKKLMKAVEELINTDDVKAVHITDTEVVQTLYGMTEQDFINGATILDPATRKALDSEDEDSEVEE